MIRQRSVWMAARARNAARQGVWIAVFGAIATIATLLVLVLVPREVDRQLRRRIATLPAAPDTLPLIRLLDTLRVSQNASLARDSVNRDSLSLLLPDSTRGGGRAETSDSLGTLVLLIQRARQVPLAESYRALADAPLLRNDRRIATLRDSIEQVERERERFSAGGGADARYAALTLRVSAFGLQLVRLAEQQLADHVFPSTASPDTLRAQTAQRQDSVLRDSLSRRMAVVDSQLGAARLANERRVADQKALESRLQVASPPMAMLLAALVVGVMAGYGIVLLREVRRPSVGDPAEVQRLTGAPVLLYTRGGPSTLADRRRSRERPGVPRIIDRDSDTFALLHLALTGVGDIVAAVDVVADAPTVAAAVALGTAAAAARESRAVLVVEATHAAPLLGHLLNAKVRNTTDDVRAGIVEAEEAVHVITLERDAHIDLLIAARPDVERRGLFTRRRAAAIPSVRPQRRVRNGSSSDVALRDAPTTFEDTLRALDANYDLRLQLLGGQSDGWPVSSDVIVCARQGATPLAWLATVVQHTRVRQQRVRAVVLWSRDVPAA